MHMCNLWWFSDKHPIHVSGSYGHVGIKLAVPAQFPLSFGRTSWQKSGDVVRLPWLFPSPSFKLTSLTRRSSCLGGLARLSVIPGAAPDSPGGV